MKKLLLLVVGLIVFIPFGVKAADKLSWDCDTTSLRPGETSTCTLYANTTIAMSQFNATITAKGRSTIESIVPASGWTGSTANGIVSLTNATPQTGKFAILSVTWRLNADYEPGSGEPCGIQLVEENNPTPVETNPVPNPDTGSSLSYILISGGAVLAVAAYFLVSKREKFYKI